MKFKLLLVTALSPVLSIAQADLPPILSPSPLIQMEAALKAQDEALLKAAPNQGIETPAQARQKVMQDIETPAQARQQAENEVHKLGQEADWKNADPTSVTPLFR
jgi:hypothetical protein